MRDYKPRKKPRRGFSFRKKRSASDLAGRPTGLRAYSRPVRRKDGGGVSQRLSDWMRRLLHPWPLVYAAAGLWLAGGLGLGAWYIRELPLTKIEFHGNAAVTEAEILTQAGLSLGMPMGTVDPFRVAALLMTHPRIRGADVRRRFPDELTIALHEREPRILLIRADGVRILLDSEGVAVGETDPTHPPAGGAGLLEVRGLSYAPAPGEKVLDPLLDAARLAQSRMEALTLGEGAKLIRVNLEDPFLMQLILADGTRLLVLPDQVETALSLYQSLLLSLPEMVRASRELDFSTLADHDGGWVILRPQDKP